MQISDLYSQWIEAAAVSENFPQFMFSLNNRHQIHLNLVTGTDFLGKTYRAYEDLIMSTTMLIWQIVTKIWKGSGNASDI